MFCCREEYMNKTKIEKAIRITNAISVYTFLSIFIIKIIFPELYITLSSAGTFISSRLLESFEIAALQLFLFTYVLLPFTSKSAKSDMNRFRFYFAGAVALPIIMILFYGYAGWSLTKTSNPYYLSSDKIDQIEKTIKDPDTLQSQKIILSKMLAESEYVTSGTHRNIITKDGTSIKYKPDKQTIEVRQLSQDALHSVDNIHLTIIISIVTFIISLICAIWWYRERIKRDE